MSSNRQTAGSVSRAARLRSLSRPLPLSVALLAPLPETTPRARVLLKCSVVRQQQHARKHQQHARKHQQHARKHQHARTHARKHQQHAPTLVLALARWPWRSLERLEGRGWLLQAPWC